MSKETLLLDMDGVTWDFAGHIIERLRKSDIHIAMRTLEKFHFADNMPEGEMRARVKRIYSELGFFSTMPMIEGAKEAINELRESYDVRFCSSPLSAHPACEEEKREAIAREFGAEMADAAYIGRDKTIVSGAILIDDKPEVDGENKAPSWEHLIFNQPWNFLAVGPRMFSWEDTRPIDELARRIALKRTRIAL